MKVLFLIHSVVSPVLLLESFISTGNMYWNGTGIMESQDELSPFGKNSFDESK